MNTSVGGAAAGPPGWEVPAQKFSVQVLKLCFWTLSQLTRVTAMEAVPPPLEFS